MNSDISPIALTRWLAGGYVHLGLADLTGFVPRQIGLKPGYMGYSDNVQDGDNLWNTIKTCVVCL